MKKLRILGIGMTFVMLASLFGFAGLASAAGPGEQQWDYILNPTDSTYKIAAGSGPIDMVFSGSQGYMIEKGYGSSTTKNRLFRSNNSGQYWGSKSDIQSASLGWSTGRTFVAVAVAPDDKLSIALTDGVSVWMSADEGDTWSVLPAVTLGTNEKITDVAVGPARSGLLLDREYVVTIANTGAGVTTGGDVKILGANAVWTTVGTAINGTRDYLSVEFSPNYLGDRTVIAIGANNTTLSLDTFGVATTGGSTRDTQTVITDLTTNLDADVVAGSMAFPTDFDPFTSAADMVMVGVARTAGTGGVYKVIPSDDSALQLLTTAANVKSVAYAGTLASGTLFAGYNSTNDIRRTDNPLTTSPTWTSASKKPTGTGVIVRLDANYASNQTVFALTTGDAIATTGGSAFSVSQDNGVSFSQWSMIDYSGTYAASMSTLGSILDFVLTTDETQCWYIVNDTQIGTSGNATPPDSITGSLHVWKADMPLSSTTYYKMLTIPKTATANNTALLALNPDWATTPAIYVVDNTGGTTTASTVYVSKNGGATWSQRPGPSGTRINGILVTDANTIHAVCADAKAYKSVNSGAVWADGVSASSSPMNMIKAPDGTLVMGRSGGIYYSSNDGTSWSTKSLGCTSGVNYYVGVDADFATNKTYYIAGDDGSVMRITPSDPAFISISPSTAVAITGRAKPVLKFGSGVLYVLTTDGVLRNLDYLNSNPANVVAAWEKLDAISTSFFYPAAAPAAPNNTLAFQGPVNRMLLYGGNNVLLANLAYRNFSYRDFLSNNAPTLIGPADGKELSIDPNTGSGLPVLFEWQTMGTGMGVPSAYQLEIKEVGGTTSLSQTFGVSDFAAPSVSSGATSGTGSGFTSFTFRANTEYQWRLRVRDALSADAVRSPWSAWRTIKVLSGTQVVQSQAGPILLGPQGGATTSLTPGFTWAPVPGATEYQFILATDAGLTQTVANTPAMVTSPAFQVTTDLTANTTYFWAVRSSKPTVGEQSIGTFTAAVPAAAAAPTQPVINVQPPEVTVNVPPIEIPQQPAAASPITAALVWVVIAIGAILIIAVIVLIVRTRRPL